MSQFSAWPCVWTSHCRVSTISLKWHKLGVWSKLGLSAGHIMPCVYLSTGVCEGLGRDKSATGRHWSGCLGGNNLPAAPASGGLLKFVDCRLLFGDGLWLGTVVSVFAPLLGGLCVSGPLLACCAPAVFAAGCSMYRATCAAPVQPSFAVSSFFYILVII